MSSPISSPQVFICHQHEDKPFARRIASDLEQAGFKTWVDEAEILVGDSLVSVISKAITDVDFVAVLVSLNSIGSSWVKKELELSMTKEIDNRKVVVLPLKLDDCEMPAFLRDKLYADFSRGTYAEEFARLVRSIRGHLERQGSAASKDSAASVAPTGRVSSASSAVLRGSPISTSSNTTGGEGDVSPVEKTLIEDFCDQLHFPHHARLRSWCAIHDILSHDELILISERKYSSTSLANVTRTLLHRLNGTPGFGSKPNPVLFWETVERIAELNGLDSQAARKLLVSSVDKMPMPPQPRRDEHRVIGGEKVLFGQLVQLIDFLGPFGPAKGTFSVPSDWHSFAAAYGATDLIGSINDRLQRSQRFGDRDYPAKVYDVLLKLAQRSQEQATNMVYALTSHLMPQLQRQPQALQKQARSRFPPVFGILESVGA